MLNNTKVTTTNNKVVNKIIKLNTPNGTRIRGILWALPPDTQSNQEPFIINPPEISASVQRKIHASNNIFESIQPSPAPSPRLSSLDFFYNDLLAHNVVSVDIDSGKDIIISYTNNNKEVYQLNIPASVGIIDELINNLVTINYNNQQSTVLQGYTKTISKFIVENAFTIIFLAILLYSMILQRSAMSSQNRFFKSNNKQIDPEDVEVTFADVAGLENAKQELMEIVEFLKNPDKFTSLGAKIPRGCLLTGGPGLGKTLLAKAVSGEAGVPFFATSASEFIELFVGVGASRVRDLFTKANELSPCIIFIDEIDAIGKSRSSNSMMPSNDEREQTINQLLTEMDGFASTSGVVVIAATNRPDILDSALIRPGRFDRQIELDPPTLSDREAILKIHCKDKPISKDVNFTIIAKNTVGLSGAELANIANEAAILAARRGSENIIHDDFMNSIDRVILGPKKSNHLISIKKKKIIACHEAGHAVTALRVGEFDDVTKISIIPRGKAGGVTMFEQLGDNIDNALYSKKYLENKLVVALGGRAAEEIVYGDANVTTGAYNDMEIVAQLARAMIVNYGFNDKMGPVSWSEGPSHSQYSNSNIIQNKIDKEVLELVKKSYTRAKYILQNNEELFFAIAEELYNKEVLTQEDVKKISSKFP